jgi:hypothetical protein
VRDSLIESPDQYPFEVFSELYSHNVSVNWPYDCEDAVVQISTSLGGGGDQMQLSPIFEKHVRKLENWTVSPVFEAHYPELAGFIAASKQYRA